MIFYQKILLFFKNIEDLSYKINKYKKDSKERKKIAKRGKNYYLKYLNSTLVADFTNPKHLILKVKIILFGKNKCFLLSYQHLII